MRRFFLAFIALFILQNARAADWEPQSTLDAKGIVTAFQATQSESIAGGEIVNTHFFSRVDFSRGDAALTVAQAKLLDPLGAALATVEMKDAGLILVGHSSTDGDAAKNLALSHERIMALANYLMRKFAISPDRISVNPLGETEPKSGKPTDDPAQRRVDIYITSYAPQKFEPASIAIPAGVLLAEFAKGKGEWPAPITELLPLPTEAGIGGLGLGDAGTVEFWVQPGWNPEKPPAYAPVVLAAAGADGSTFSVQIGELRDSIALWDGDPVSLDAELVRYDFTADVPHHVAIVTEAGVTVLWIDGVERGELKWTYGQTLESYLFIGALDAEGTMPFEGRLGGVRIWNRALRPEEIAAAITRPNNPGASFALYGALSGYSTDDGRGGLNFETLPPQIDILAGAWATYGSDVIKIEDRDFLAEGLFDGDPQNRGRADGLEDDTALRSHHVDLLKGKVPGADTAFSSYPLFYVWQEPASGGALDADPVPAVEGKTETFRAPDGSRLKMLDFGWNGSAFVGAVAWYRMPDGLVRSQFLALQAASPTQRQRWQLDDDEFPVGVSGMATDKVVSLTLHTNKRTLQPIGAPPGSVPGATPFSQFLPIGAPFDGFSMQVEANWLTAIGLLADVESERAAIVVVREDGAATRFHQIDRNTYESVHDASPVSTVKRPRLVVENEALLRIDGIPYDIVPLHARDKPKGETSSFDNVFVAQAKAVNLQSNYKAYDITRMDPLHLTDSGSGKLLFALPDPAGTDFYDANRIFVPNGLIYVPEFTGEQHSQTHIITSMSDFSKATSFSVGLTGGAEGAEFSGSYSHERMTEKIRGRNKSVTLGVSKAAFYDLVLDKGRMKLSDDFAARVARLKTHGTPQDYRDFVRLFGTHYPQAAVYGGMGILEMEYTGDQIARLVNDEVNISASAQASLEGEAKAGGNISSGKSSSSKFEQEMSDQLDNFYWVGGAHAGLSKESWGVGLDGVVPIYVNLRPLDELLAPPFFFDPVILHDVRFRLRDTIAAYVAEAARKQEIDVDTMPRLFEVKLVKVAAAVPTLELDTTWEIGGKILVADDVPRGREDSRARTLFDNKTPPPDGPQPQSTDLVEVPTLPPSNAYYFNDTDNEIDGSLSQTFAVPPCAVELGASMEIAGRLIEYDAFVEGGLDKAMTGERRLAYRDFPLVVGQPVTIGLEDVLLRSRNDACLLTDENIVKGAVCAMAEVLKADPLNVGCALNPDAAQRAMCNEIKACMADPQRKGAVCQEFRFICNAPPKIGPNGICERAVVTVEVRETGDSFASPPRNPACPATLEEFNRQEDARLRGAVAP